MLRHLILIFLFLFGLPTGLAAQSPTSDKLEPFSWLVGSWQCSGISFGDEQVKSRAYTSRMDVNRDLKGKWLSFFIVLTPENTASPVAEGRDFWGVDPQSGTVKEIFFDSYGDTGEGRVTATSARRVLLEGKGGGNPSELYYRVAFESRTDNKLEIRFDVGADGKQWRKRTEELCKIVRP